MLMTRRATLTALASALCLPAVAGAAPTRYALDTGASRVGFRFTLNGAAQKGTMPVRAAAVTIDPANLGASMVDVSVNVRGAQTGLLFATQALVGPEVLDAAHFPVIRFVSERVRLAADGRLSGGARIHGRLTIRDVTRPVDLTANLYRPPGTRPDDLQTLQVQLSSEISRSAFGASGYPKLVADTVTLDIFAVVHALA